MEHNAIQAVTGAFGYSGKHIAGRLLAKGQRVITLTNSARRANPFGSAVAAHSFNFGRPDLLIKSWSRPSAPPSASGAPSCRCHRAWARPPAIPG